MHLDKMLLLSASFFFITLTNAVFIFPGPEAEFNGGAFGFDTRTKRDVRQTSADAYDALKWVRNNFQAWTRGNPSSIQNWPTQVTDVVDALFGLGNNPQNTYNSILTLLNEMLRLRDDEHQRVLYIGNLTPMLTIGEDGISYDTGFSSNGDDKSTLQVAIGTHTPQAGVWDPNIAFSTSITIVGHEHARVYWTSRKNGPGYGDASGQVHIYLHRQQVIPIPSKADGSFDQDDRSWQTINSYGLHPGLANIEDIEAKCEEHIHEWAHAAGGLLDDNHPETVVTDNKNVFWPQGVYGWKKCVAARRQGVYTLHVADCIMLFVKAMYLRPGGIVTRWDSETGNAQHWDGKAWVTVESQQKSAVDYRWDYNRNEYVRDATLVSATSWYWNADINGMWHWYQDEEVIPDESWGSGYGGDEFTDIENMEVTDDMFNF